MLDLDFKLVYVRQSTTASHPFHIFTLCVEGFDAINIYIKKEKSYVQVSIAEYLCTVSSPTSTQVCQHTQGT